MAPVLVTRFEQGKIQFAPLLGRQILEKYC